MTDIILSSFISLFALFGKEEQVDEVRAKNMLVSYLHRHFGIRNTDLYVDLYADMRMAYEMTEDLNTVDTVTSICSNLQGDIRKIEKDLLLLRLMEFCHGGFEANHTDVLFKTMAQLFNIPQEQYNDFIDFVDHFRTFALHLYGQRHRIAERRAHTDGLVPGLDTEQRAEKQERKARLLLVDYQYLRSDAERG